jgi:hypothetical protein
MKNNLTAFEIHSAKEMVAQVLGATLVATTVLILTLIVLSPILLPLWLAEKACREIGSLFVK